MTTLTFVLVILGVWVGISSLMTLAACALSSQLSQAQESGMVPSVRSQTSFVAKPTYVPDSAS